MNRSPIFRTLLFCLVLIMGLTVAQAQSANLLTNPGFENPFEPVAGSTGSMVAQGWTAWSVQTGQNQPPEYYPATDTTNGMLKPRIHSGSDAQQYFTFFAPHTGGVYQNVTGLAAGDELTFSIYVYVWESSGDNVDASDGSGDLSVQVGIDPTGGTDATSSAIVWSNALSVVDQFAQHTVSATAAGDNVTVFVRSTVNKVAMNNTVYLDDAELVVTGTGGVVPVVTEQATEAVTVEAVQPTVVTEAATEATVEVIVPTEVATEATEIVAAATEVVTSEAVTEQASQATTVEALATTEAPTATSTPTVIIPTDTPTDTPSPVPPTDTPTDIPPTATPSPSPTLDTTAFPLMFQYKVVRGDTVGKLATRYGSTVEAIIIANGLNSDAYIYETQILMIPVVALPTPTPTASETPIPPTATPITPTAIPPTNVPPTAVPPTLIPPTPTETAIPVMPASTATTVTQAQSVIQPPSTPVVIVQTYVVAYGDTLSSIASRFGVATMDLARVNQIVNPNLIRLGQVLNIPASGNPTPVPTASSTATATSTATTAAPTAITQPHLYQVQRGDNLYSISIKLNVPISVLIEANGIYNANRIFVGQILIIP